MLLDQIGLTTEQRAAIDSILQDGREKIDAYWKETEPGYRALVDTTRAHVRAVLTPDQLSEYDRLRAEHRARARAREEGGAERANQNGGKSISSGYGGGVNGWSSINSKRHAEAKETRSE
jgi:Spy/CpxP family protein refolding chaperone